MFSNIYTGTTSNDGSNEVQTEEIYKCKIFIYFFYIKETKYWFPKCGHGIKIVCYCFRQIYATQQKRHSIRLPPVPVASQVQKQQCVATNLHATENHWSITVSDTSWVLQKYAPPDITSQVAFNINDYHDNDLRNMLLC